MDHVDRIERCARAQDLNFLAAFSHREIISRTMPSCISNFRARFFHEKKISLFEKKCLTKKIICPMSKKMSKKLDQNSSSAEDQNPVNKPDSASESISSQESARKSKTERASEMIAQRDSEIADLKKRLAAIEQPVTDHSDNDDEPKQDEQSQPDKAALKAMERKLARMEKETKALQAGQATVARERDALALEREMGRLCREQNLREEAHEDVRLRFQRDFKIVQIKDGEWGFEYQGSDKEAKFDTPADWLEKQIQTNQHWVNSGVGSHAGIAAGRLHSQPRAGQSPNGMAREPDYAKMLRPSSTA